MQALDALQRLSACRREAGPAPRLQVRVCVRLRGRVVCRARAARNGVAGVRVRSFDREDVRGRGLAQRRHRRSFVGGAAWRVVEPILDAETRELLQFVVCGGADPAAALEDVGVPRRAFPRTAWGIALAACVLAGGEQEASEKLDAMDARAARPPLPACQIVPLVARAAVPRAPARCGSCTSSASRRSSRPRTRSTRWTRTFWPRSRSVSSPDGVGHVFPLDVMVQAIFALVSYRDASPACMHQKVISPALWRTSARPHPEA